MMCKNCPYGCEDFIRLSELYDDDFSREDIERNIWCDKVGGMIGNMGYCNEDIEQENISMKQHSNRRKRNKRERYLKHQHHLKYLYEIAGGYYPAPVGYIDEIMVEKYKYIKNPKPYYKRWYRGKRSPYLKQQSNKKIRRYKGELHNGNMAHKLYDFWWEFC